MFRAFIASLLLAGLSSFTFAQQLPADHAKRMKAGTELFRDSVRSALKQHCLKCHGGEKTRAGFDLSSRDRLLKGGDSGPVIDLKTATDSYLLQLVRHDDEPTMPPAADKLPKDLIANLQRWIELGAPYDKPLVDKQTSETAAMQVTQSDRDFWSFRPLSNPKPPAIQSEWPRTDTDRFVLAKLNEQGLRPNPVVDDRVRIRRLYLDLIGLPPTIEQIDAALQISHEALIDQLLESPHYGERWARHWLDAARFGESHGFEQDYNRKFAYHYRDFVIKALNTDMPWDQFVRWQLAGDEIAPDKPLAMMATGFLGAGVFPTQLTEKEFESARYDELDDMAATVGTSMLGLTIGCARCHDHKFDPLPVKDYYRFVSTFTTTIRSEIDIDLDPQGYKDNLAKWSAKHAQLVANLDDFGKRPETVQKFNQWLEADALSSLQKNDWTILTAITATSNQKATTLTPTDDGSIVASGNAPAKETYTIKAKADSLTIQSIRIEALTDPSMKRNGPGRAGNGNFALSNLTVFATSAETNGKRLPIKFSSAKATHQQNKTNLSVASSIDADQNRTGWAVDAGGIGKDQAAVFVLEKPLEFTSSGNLEFQLRFTNNSQHSMGRFRLSVSPLAEPVVAVGTGQTQAISNAVAAAKNGQLTAEHRGTLFPLFVATQSEWKELANAVKQSETQKPKPKMVKVQVSSEGFPPTKHHADGRGFPHFYPQTHFLSRGDPSQKQGVAEAGFLQVLMRDGKTSDDWNQAAPDGWTRTSYRRTAMANWITDTDNGAGHLLARVIVNRLWHHHFGRGIVATPNDFGLQGTPPTHPELLDFLAQQLIANGWNLKPLHRQLLQSATWLQSTTGSTANEKIDPENKWFWRYPTRRIEAEIVRDAMLAASGQLDARMYGPGTLSPNQRRRSIYFMIKRSQLIPMMQIFDQPEPLSSQGRRPSTTIAPQALLFMNNAEVLKWAAALASSVNDKETSDAIRDIYLRTLTREPTADELASSSLFVKQQTQSYANVKEGRRLALADLCQVVFGLNEFIYLP